MSNKVSGAERLARSGMLDTLITDLPLDEVLAIVAATDDLPDPASDDAPGALAAPENVPTVRPGAKVA